MIVRHGRGTENAARLVAAVTIHYSTNVLCNANFVFRHVLELRDEHSCRQPYLLEA
jgi:hypothetical protein